MDRSDVVEIVLGALREQLEADAAEDCSVSEDTPLIGDGAPIDSLGLVSVIVATEDRILAMYGISLTLVDEQAMSQRNSPFRTVATLAAYAVEGAAQGGDDSPHG